MRKPCCDKQDTNKGAWSKQEDEKLIEYIRKHGEGCWRTLPKNAGLLRCGKSCRLRWINYLRPDLKRGNFAEDEEDLIIKLHALLGNRWSLIAGRLPGRTDNEVKNYWNSHLRRKLINMGIDPNNHRLVSHIHPCSSNRILGYKNIHPRSKSPQNSSISTSSTTSFAPKNSPKDNYHQSVKSQEERVVPDLNLDLTINLPNSTGGAKVEEDEQKKQIRDKSSDTCRQQEFTPSPTLLLFP